MKFSLAIRIVAAVVFAAGNCSIGDAQEGRYSFIGDHVLLNVESAAFPHPQRANGHVYKGQQFPREPHYTNNTVAVFRPKGATTNGPVDCIVHFHGWRNNVTNVLWQYELIEQLVESGRDALLIVPQGPFNAPDSFGGKLEDPGGLERFLAEVTTKLRGTAAFTNVEFGRLILSGHSGGYQVMASILAQEKMATRVKEVWLFDGLYAQTEKFQLWSEKNPQTRFINIYTENGGTKGRTEELMQKWRENKQPFLATNEMSVGYDELKTNRAIFLFTHLAHDDVVQKRRTFRLLAFTSSLPPISNFKSIVSPKQRNVPGKRIPLSNGTLFAPDFFQPVSNKADVIIFFHGADWCVQQGFVDARKNALLVTVSAKSFGELFKTSAEFEKFLSELNATLQKEKVCESIGKIGLASFSGGYGAVRNILSHETHRERISDVVLADSLYGPKEKDNPGKMEAAGMEPFLKFAQRAAAGKATFWFSHLYPPEAQHRGNTTTLAANYLIEALKAERRPGNFRNEQGALALYRADKGNFHVIGFAGMNNQDHFDHFYTIGELFALRDGDTNGVFLRCKIHGHLGYADATVFDGVRRRTKIP